MDKQNIILDALPLLQKLPEGQLDEFVSSYKSILFLARLVQPFLIMAILGVLAAKVVSGTSMSYETYQLFKVVFVTVMIVCVAVLIFLVPASFIKISALKKRVFASAASMDVDQSELLNEFVRYVHTIIRKHYGVSLGK